MTDPFAIRQLLLAQPEVTREEALAALLKVVTLAESGDAEAFACMCEFCGMAAVSDSPEMNRRFAMWISKNGSFLNFKG